MPAAPYVGIATALAASWIVLSLLRFRFSKSRPNLVAKKLQAEDAAFAKEEDAQARYRITAGRLARAIPSNGGFDVVLIGSGPGSLGCAAALSMLGYKCCVLEQGHELGGGARVQRAGVRVRDGRALPWQ